VHGLSKTSSTGSGDAVSDHDEVSPNAALREILLVDLQVANELKLSSRNFQSDIIKWSRELEEVIANKRTVKRRSLLFNPFSSST
jgi:hypothetical protein